VDVTGNITAKLCEVGSEFNIFCTLVPMATATILIFFSTPQKLPHTMDAKCIDCDFFAANYRIGKSDEKHNIL
jgi:hypothetical protein